MLYKLANIQQRQGKSGKAYWTADFTLNGETKGTASSFDPLVEEMDGELVQNGSYLNFKRSGGNLGPKPAWAKKEGEIKKAQERKAGYIREAQDKKELSIAYFNSCNLAIQALEKIGQFDKEAFVNLRDFFLEEWQKWDAKDEESKRIPF